MYVSYRHVCTESMLRIHICNYVYYSLLGRRFTGPAGEVRDISPGGFLASSRDPRLTSMKLTCQDPGTAKRSPKLP